MAYKVFFHHFVRLTIEAVYTFVSSISKGLNDAQSFLGYVFSTKLSFRIIFPLFSITSTRAHSITGGNMMNRRQLQWC